MNKTVVKFGGSNLRTPADVQRVAKVVTRYQGPLIVVVSAFYGVTNALIAALESARNTLDDLDGAPQGGFTASLRELHRRLVEENLPDQAVRDTTWTELSRRLDQLERLLMGVHYLRDLPAPTHDLALSYGERLSACLLTQVLRSHGLPAIELSPEEMGLRTDGEFGNATCDFAASEATVRAATDTGTLYVVPGFYAMGSDGRPRLFGRGGSDYSAASIARCVHAGSLDLWKDVSGFLSGEPGTIPSPRVISHLNYLEAAELSYFGAKILHPRTVEPLLDQSIPIRLMDIRDGGQGIKPCTIIDAQRTVSGGMVKAVSSTDDIGILKIHGPGVGFKAGILARATGALDEAGINIKSVLTAQTAICLLLARGDLMRASDILAEHHLAGVVNVSLVDDLALVAVVGDGVLSGSTPGHAITTRAIDAAEDGGIPVSIAAAGASDVALYLLVPRPVRTQAIRVIHDAFFPPDQA